MAAWGGAYGGYGGGVGQAGGDGAALGILQGLVQLLAQAGGTGGFGPIRGGAAGVRASPFGVGKGGGKGKMRVSRAGDSGEVRFSTQAAAQAALQMNGMPLQGSPIMVQADPRSHDFTKLIVTNLPEGIQWQQLKDHFKQCGEVSFANVIGPGEVRFASAEEASQVVMSMNGYVLEGKQISVKLDPTSPDNTKVIVDQLPPTFQWQQLKDLFKECGSVQYADR